MTSKYYAVISGRSPGIYNNWAVAESMVKGFPGAVYKSFLCRMDAERFMKNSTHSKSSPDPKTVSDPLPLVDKTIIYTDGSYSSGVAGFGVVIIASNGDKYHAYGRVPINLGATNNIAELYAIYVALSLVEEDIILYTDSTYCVDCLTTYVYEYQLNGWSKVPNADIIQKIYSKMQNRNVVFHHIKREFNTQADEYSKVGRASADDLIVIKNGEVIDLAAAA